jgi:long-chain acyl-CoA synthetase
MDIPTRLFDFPYYQLEHFPMEISMTSKVDGEWKPYSTQSLIDHANMISRGLLELGAKAGDKIALISHNNRCEWNIMDIGTLQIGAIDVPVYPTMSPEDFKYILNHSESKFCFVSNADLAEKVNSVKDQIPTLEAVFTFEKVDGQRNWQEVLDLGKSDARQAEVQAAMDNVKAKDLATLIYTSGTTGLPKGVMLSHENIASNAVHSAERLPHFEAGNSRTLSFLPVCHIFERMMHYLYFYSGVKVYFGESLETIKADLALARPHAFSAVPRLLEKFYDGIVAKGSAAGGIKKGLFMWAVGLALRWEPDGQNGAWYEFQLKIARKLVFSKVKAALGLTEIGAVASGSAALQPRLARFFNGADIPVYEGYGLTETSPVMTVNTLNQPHMLRPGYVGKTITNCEVKIAEDGEILCKGPNIMIGYYKDQEKTDEVLKNGWFHTGDIGVVEDGFLKITDRKKEIFKTSGGKYVAPQLIENSLKASPLIEQCIVIGESQRFPAALIAPSFDGLRTWCKKHNISYTTDAEMITNEKIKARIWRDVETTNQGFGKWEQVKEIRILPALFTIEGGELTPTLKLKRKPIMTKYAALVDEIYAYDPTDNS